MCGNIIKKISIKQGFYNINKFIEILNLNDDLAFTIDISQKININTIRNDMIQIIYDKTSNKLGFTEEDCKTQFDKTISACRLPDLRLPTKLYIYILNLQDSPVGILNFNGVSICDLVFKAPISLDKLDIKFTTEDNVEYNFNSILYNLSFQIDIIDEDV